MSFRVKACAATVAAACVLFTPAAMASPGISHAQVQVTGKQLKNGLLPPSHILPGYTTIFSDNSGGKLERSGRNINLLVSSVKSLGPLAREAANEAEVARDLPRAHHFGHR